MGSNLTVMKLGGSLLTDKTQQYVARESVIKQVAHEIRHCIDDGLIDSLVLTFGVGSFGHPPVIKHELYKGFKSPDQLLLLAETQYVVNRFRMLLSRHMLDANIPVNLMHASSMVTAEKMRFRSYFLDTIRGFLSLGMVVMVGGDMVYDSAMGFSVGSGDQLAVVIAREFNAKRLLFVTDVAGVYTADPKVDQHAQLLSEINLAKLDELHASLSEESGKDASGRMRGKLLTLNHVRDNIANGMETYIFSMLQPGNLTNLLHGASVPCTRIVVH